MISRTDYASGLRLITERMPGVRSVTLGVWVGVGSRDEAPQVWGASHFLEHVLFKGTRRRSARDIAEAFDAVGGDLNAFTSKEHTTFYARVLDGDLPMAIDHLADMLQDSVVRGEDVDAERKVILEEINMHQDSPDELVHDEFATTLWGAHPLGRQVLGSVDTITGMSRDDVERFWRSHYVPGAFVVVAAGSVHHEGLARLVEGLVDTGPRVEESVSSVRTGDVPPEPAGRSSVLRRPTEQAHICLGTNGLPRSDPRRFAMGVLNSAIGGGMSSRLFQEIREKRGLAYSVYSFHAMYAETGLFCVYAGTTPQQAPEVLTIVRDELDDVAERGLGGPELDRAKGHLKGSLVLSQEDTEGRASRLGKSEIGHGEILTVDEVIDRVEAVSADDCREVAGDVFRRPRGVAVIGPFEEDAFAPFARGEVPTGGAGGAAARRGRSTGRP